MTITPEAPARPRLAFLELELTERCQLTCGNHCYVQAGPTKGHGSMTNADWVRVVDEAAALGVQTVQLIGGEPTLHPHFTDIAWNAVDAQMQVRVYSNLYRVRREHWELYGHRSVRLATSYYSDDPAEHDAITGRPGSHDSTRANIVEAVRRGIKVKVGIVHLEEGQRSVEARAEMLALGVDQVHVDRVRAIGNAARGALPSTSSLCGRCGDGRAMVLSDGSVAPCGMGRFLPAGNVKAASLGSVLSGTRWAQVVESIPRPRTRAGCTPDEDSCMPSPRTSTTAADGCNPDSDGSDCAPAETEACDPAYD